MKKILLSFIFLGIALVVKPQDTSVEQSVFGVQTGLFGIWAHNEYKLNDKFALRSEIGFDGLFWQESYYFSEDFSSNYESYLLIPVITLEPKWYYNLEKRQSKQKRIDGNSGNFVSFKTRLHPDWFVINFGDEFKLAKQISFIPTWGIRRHFGRSNFNYEVAIGLGYVHCFGKEADYSENESDVLLDIHLRIGYRF